MSADLTGQRLGHYQVQEVIGRGGMSVIYRAVDVRLERSVALKVMSPDLSADSEFRSRFAEEARAASAIDHVNVVPLYDFGEHADRLYIAMRLVDGTDLAREIAAGPLPMRRVLALLGQVGAALDVLHERGLVHLDAKPANVLITRNESVGTEHVYLADFGLTRRNAGGHRTAAGDFLGSPTYASPEHLRGEQVGPAADLYSLTCMLFAALSGRAPYVGDVREVISGHLSGEVPSLSALTGHPLAVDRVVARGMAGAPSARYPTSADLLSAMRRALEAAGSAGNADNADSADKAEAPSSGRPAASVAEPGGVSGRPNGMGARAEPGFSPVGATAAQPRTVGETAAPASHPTRGAPIATAAPRQPAPMPPIPRQQYAPAQQFARTQPSGPTPQYTPAGQYRPQQSNPGHEHGGALPGRPSSGPRHRVAGQNQRPGWLIAVVVLLAIAAITVILVR